MTDIQETLNEFDRAVNNCVHNFDMPRNKAKKWILTSMLSDAQDTPCAEEKRDIINSVKIIINTLLMA